MANPVARLGDSSDHGGTIITAGSKLVVEGQPAARVTDMHSCPIPGHGVTAIQTGSPNLISEGQRVARSGSVCGCGAVIIGGATKMLCT